MTAFGFLETAPVIRGFEGGVENCETFAAEEKVFILNPSIVTFYRELAIWEREPGMQARKQNANGVFVRLFPDGWINRTYCNVAILGDEDHREAAGDPDSSTITDHLSDDARQSEEEREEGPGLPWLGYIGSTPLLDIPRYVANEEEMTLLEESALECSMEGDGIFRVLAPFEKSDGIVPSFQGANAVFVYRSIEGTKRHPTYIAGLKEKGIHNG